MDEINKDVKKSILVPLDENTHTEFKAMSTLIGQTMQNIAAYAIKKEIDKFKQEHPSAQELFKVKFKQ